MMEDGKHEIGKEKEK